MEKETNKNTKNIITGISVILFYIIISCIPDYIFSLFGINYNKLNITTKSIYLTFYEIITLFIIIYIYKTDFINNLKNYLKNIKYYINNYIKYWFLTLVLMFISNSIITLFTTSNISNNQESIIDTLKIAPFYTIIVTVFIAPIMEELIFRLSIKKIFKNKIIFIIISGLFFGSVHVLGNFNNIIDLLFIIPYSIPGFIFAYTYIKSENIFVPISLHFIHNCVMMLLQLLLILT